jgi:hypothetical protein
MYYLLRRPLGWILGSEAFVVRAVWLIRAGHREVGDRVVRSWGRACKLSASGPALVTRTVDQVERVASGVVDLDHPVPIVIKTPFVLGVLPAAGRVRRI